MGKQESSRNGREYTAEVAGKVFPPSPETEPCLGRAALKDCHDVPVASPTMEAAQKKVKAVLRFATCAAGMSISPQRKATVSIPFRARVSSQPYGVNRSAIQPPRGMETPKIK
jgi:hypothetical protein